MDKILRINVSPSDGPAALYEPLGAYAGTAGPDKPARLGGRALAAKIACEEIPCGCHALGPENKLVLAPGLLCSASAIPTNRLCVGCKSPLTGKLQIANVSTEAAGCLSRLGIAAVIVEGKPATKNLFLVTIAANEIRIVAENSLRMLTNYELIESFKPAYGDSISVISIGTAGEMRMASSTIAFTDPELRPTRHAGRGGTGAVMGSKGIKAIILNPAGTPPREPANPDLFHFSQQAVATGVRNHPVGREKQLLYGSNALNQAYAAYGEKTVPLATQNVFSGAAARNKTAFPASEAMDASLDMFPQSCLCGCSSGCSCLYPEKDDRQPVSQALWAADDSSGSWDADIAGTLAFLSDTYGFDALEISASLSLVMEAGLLRFGDMEGVIRLIHEVGKGTPLGRLLGAGAASVAKAYGITDASGDSEYARPFFPLCCTEETDSPRSAALQHELRLGVPESVRSLLTEDAVLPLLRQERGKGALRKQQAAASAMDALGCCLFLAFVILDQPDTFQALVEMVNGLCGTRFTTDSLLELGDQALQAEQEYNARSASMHHDWFCHYARRELHAPGEAYFGGIGLDGHSVYHV